MLNWWLPGCKQLLGFSGFFKNSRLSGFDYNTIFRAQKMLMHTRKLCLIPIMTTASVVYDFTDTFANIID